MSSVLNYPLVLNAREYREITVRFKDAQGEIKSFPTGTTATAQIVDYIGVTTFVEFTCTINSGAGSILMVLPKVEADKLQNFTPGKKHYWNLFVNYPGDRPIKKIDGSVTVNKAAV